MNKARITYRFDPNGNRDQAREEENGSASGTDDAGRIIPLYREEYRVVDERKEARDNGEEERHRQERARKEERPVRDYQGLNQYTSDFGAWSSPYDAETKRIEDLIRESNEREGRHPIEPEREWDREPARGQGQDAEDRYNRYLTDDEEQGRDKHYNGQTGYYRPDEGYESRRRDEQWEGPVVHGPRYVRHSRPPWIKITASIAGAAVTGVLLGLFALSMFTGADQTDDKGKDAAADTQSTQEAKAASANVQGNGAKAATGGTAVSGKEAALTYAGITYSFLQHGSFAGQEGADQAKNDLVKKGLAAASEQSDKYYVFAGVAADKESASALGQLLKDTSKVDIYVKAYSVPPVSKVRWNGNADTLKSYLEQSDKLLQSINKLTVMNLDGGAPAAIDASTLQSVGTAHTAWARLSNTVAQEAGEETKGLVQRMNNAMNSAKTSLDEYKKNPSAAMLWQSQTYMLQFIIAEKELISKIGI